MPIRDRVLFLGVIYSSFAILGATVLVLAGFALQGMILFATAPITTVLGVLIVLIVSLVGD